MNNLCGPEDKSIKTTKYEEGVKNNYLFAIEHPGKCEQFSMITTKETPIVKRPNNICRFGSIIKFKIDKKFDILESCFIRIEFPQLPQGEEYTELFKYEVFHNIALFIGDSRVNRTYPEYMYIYDVVNKAYRNNNDLVQYVSLDSLFNYQIPIYMLEDSDVEIAVEFKTINDIVKNNNINKELYKLEFKFDLYSNGICLADDLVTKDIPKEVFIRQLQTSYGDPVVGGKETKLRLNFVQPISCFYIFIKDEFNNIVKNLDFDMEIYCTSINKSGETYKLSSGDSIYYNYYQPMKYLKMENGLPNGIYFHSFCMDPLNKRETGSVNFSHLGIFIKYNIKNCCEDPKYKIYVLGVNIQTGNYINGMFGMKYSR